MTDFTDGHSLFTITAVRAFSTGGFGAGQRLSVTGFVVFGLITFWIYNALRFATALRAHFERRWQELASRPGLQEVDLARLRRDGFAAPWRVPVASAALFGLAAAFVAGWAYNWILVGDEASYPRIMAAVGLSSALFYGATLLLCLWALARLRGHELAELAMHEAAPAPGGGAALSDELVRRWERQSSQVALFLVVAAPLTFSPTLGAHLWLTGQLDGHWAVVAAAACFAAAALFHVWGTALLVQLYNSHLAVEARHARPAAAAAAPRATPAGHAGHEVFISHSAKDAAAAEAVCATLEAGGVRVWMAPRDILPGVTWGEAIIDAIAASRVMVVLFSTSSNASPQVLREVERAVGKGVAVVPVRIEDVAPSKAMEYFLSSPHWLDAIEPPLGQHLERVAQVIRALLDAARS